jgi:hypothetical protein
MDERDHSRNDSDSPTMPGTGSPEDIVGALPSARIAGFRGTGRTKKGRAEARPRFRRNKVQKQPVQQDKLNLVSNLT